MALETSLRLEAPVGQVMSLSGALVGADRLGEEVTARPPLFLGHGTADPVVPFASLSLAAQALGNVGITAQTQAYEGVGHGIPPGAIEQMAALALNL